MNQFEYHPKNSGRAYTLSRPDIKIVCYAGYALRAESEDDYIGYVKAHNIRNIY